MFKKVAFSFLGIVVLAILSLVIFISLSWKKDFSESYPVNVNIKTPTDSASIAWGKYLAYGPAHCAHCHAPIESISGLEKGIEVPLSGGLGLELALGIFNAPNITPDNETGIGNRSDGEIYRMMRHNVRPNGMASLDLMPFINMSDEDIYSIIAYLRSTKAVKSKLINTEYSFMGKALLAFEAIKPGVPDDPIPVNIVREPSIEYGRYLAYAVANCRGCHTDRDLNTGEYIGDEYAGGLSFGPDNLTNGWIFKSPNLTNDPETGVIYEWSEEMFIKRLKGGNVYKYSPMPWSAFARMDTVSLKAIYRYLKSIEPVSNTIDYIAEDPES